MAILDTKIGMLPSNRNDLKQNNKSSILKKSNILF